MDCPSRHAQQGNLSFEPSRQVESYHFLSFTMPSLESSAPLFKKKKRNRQELNGKREEDATNGFNDLSTSQDEPPVSVVVHKTRKLDTTNPLVSSTGLSLARKRRLEAGDTNDELSLEDEYSSVAPRAKAGAASTPIGQDATRAVDWYDEGQASSKSGEKGSDKTTNDDGVYRGLSSYSSALPQNAPRNKQTQRGPIKAPNNIRTVTVVDYQPDVCKDYKETGYCGFGDTCKFLHDRSDYLAGWQMESAYLPNSTARDLGPRDAASEEDDEEEEIPFACLICRQPFTDPIVTRCGHYFCSSCAIKRFSKTPKCFACGAQTGGIFNSATKIIERMAKRRQDKDDERRQHRQAWGKEGSEGPGGDDHAEILQGVEIERGVGKSDAESE